MVGGPLGVTCAGFRCRDAASPGKPLPALHQSLPLRRHQCPLQSGAGGPQQRLRAPMPARTLRPPRRCWQSLPNWHFLHQQELPSQPHTPVLQSCLYKQSRAEQSRAEQSRAEQSRAAVKKQLTGRGSLAACAPIGSCTAVAFGPPSSDAGSCSSSSAAAAKSCAIGAPQRSCAAAARRRVSASFAAGGMPGHLQPQHGTSTQISKTRIVRSAGEGNCVSTRCLHWLRQYYDPSSATRSRKDLTHEDHYRTHLMPMAGASVG